jgi:hypothetical protein
VPPDLAVDEQQPAEEVDRVLSGAEEDGELVEIGDFQIVDEPEAAAFVGG